MVHRDQAIKGKTKNEKGITTGAGWGAAVNTTPPTPHTSRTPRTPRTSPSPCYQRPSNFLEQLQRLFDACHVRFLNRSLWLAGTFGDTPELGAARPDAQLIDP